MLGRIADLAGGEAARGQGKLCLKVSCGLAVVSSFIPCYFRKSQLLAKVNGDKESVEVENKSLGKLRLL